MKKILLSSPLLFFPSSSVTSLMKSWSEKSMYLFMAGTGIPAPVVSQNVTRAMTTSSRFYGNEAKRQWYDRCCGRGNGGQSEASY
jgi:hypothetical protein